MGGSSFIDAWAEGGWDDSALVAGARPRYDISAWGMHEQEQTA
jgi:hypothetical protein